MPQRILVVDDEKHIVRLIRSYLENAGWAVLTAFEGDTAMELIRTERPDLVILDLMLPGRDGWQITRAVRSDKRLAHIPILILTARVEDEDKVLGLELGADDYVTKPFNPTEITARVRAILRRASGAITPSPVMVVGDLKLDKDTMSASLGDEPLDLTPTEFAVLQTLMTSPNHTFTRTELIEKALGYTYEGMERSLDSHIKNLRKKIETDPAVPRYIETVFGVGYKLREG
ncbi:MAG: response regulator transcription factor [Anaerolineae bacterium]|nr:response regulator transcription factor [Anaerolineae bacterium]CAG1014101.1 Alkaline phosphatase synthesis transcriptional regulatory protein PhoP [Anaerolineae bacterium]